jgi:hypothetical protein
MESHTDVPRTITVSFVSMWDVLSHIGFTDTEVDGIVTYGFDNVTWGDAAYTLISTESALSRILTGIRNHYDAIEALEGDMPSRMIPAHIYTEEEIRNAFWRAVGGVEYIDLESPF